MASIEDFDIAIIGAGPAGCSTAYELGEEFNTVILDKNDIPQNKLCGGLFCEESIKVVTELGFSDDLLCNPSKLTLNYIDFDNNISNSTSRIFWNIKRKDFISWLLEMIPTSVDIFPNTTVKNIMLKEQKIELLTNKNQKIRCDYLIGADGVFSITRKALSKNNIRKILLNQAVLKSNKEFDGACYFIFDNDITQDYYSWMIPKNNRIHIGTRGDDNALNCLIRKISRHFDAKLDIVKKCKHPITYIQSEKDIYYGKDNVLLVGEAAGFVSPSSGEGISYALKSGIMAGKAIKQKGDVVQTYQQKCNSLYKNLELQTNKANYIFNSDERKQLFGRMLND